MPKKKLEIAEGALEELEPALEDVEPTPKNKKEAKVYAIAKNHLYLKDDKGNGYMLHITKEHKNVKIGDILYI